MEMEFWTIISGFDDGTSYIRTGLCASFDQFGVNIVMLIILGLVLGGVIIIVGGYRCYRFWLTWIHSDTIEDRRAEDGIEEQRKNDN
tara:strand:+ start:566 stop:826 length:261 start_codon:yes stop_codon:yes gene_type:complete